LVVVALTVMGMGPGVDVTATLCAAGAAPPANWLKVSAVVGAMRVACSTVSVTGMVMGLPVAPEDVIVIVP
jgi:hypothetical protein